MKHEILIEEMPDGRWAVHTETRCVEGPDLGAILDDLRSALTVNRKLRERTAQLRASRKRTAS